MRLLQFETDGNILVVIPQGDCSSLEAALLESDLDDILAELAAHDFAGLVVDFQLTPFFGSTMLGALIHLWRSMTEHKGRLALCNVSPAEQDVLNATRLDTVWEICPSRGAALTLLRAN